jgi:hypothetical protein
MAESFRQRDSQISEKFRQLELRYREHNVLTEKALQAALISNEKRLDIMNEFRGAMADQVSHFASRVEIESFKEIVNEKLQAIDKRIDLNEGKQSGLSLGWGILIGLTGFVSTIIGIILFFKRG